MREHAMVSSWVSQLADRVRSRDRKGWEEVVERVVPSLINMVFIKYAECVTGKSSIKASPI
jgi:hypothetical protein